MNEFINKYTLEERTKMSKDLIDANPSKIPIFIQIENDLQKILSPNILVIKLLVNIKEMLKVSLEEPLFLYIGNDLLDIHIKIEDIYKEYKHDDGFLYIEAVRKKKEKRESYVDSFLNYFEPQRLVNLKTKGEFLFYLTKINWYGKKQNRILYLDNYYMYRLEEKIPLDKQYILKDKIPYTEIDQVNTKMFNNQLIICYNDGRLVEYFVDGSSKALQCFTMLKMRLMNL